MTAADHRSTATTAPRRGWIRYAPAVVLMVVIEWLLVTPRLPVPLPGKSGTLAHTLAFAVLAAAWWVALRGALKPLPAALLAVAIAGFWGGIGEMQQRYVPGRTSDFADFAADVAGALLAVTPLALWARRRGPARESDA